MTKREIAALSCRVLAIVALISALQAYVYIAGEFFRTLRDFTEIAFTEFRIEPEPILNATLQALPVALLLALALLLWKRAEFIGARMLGERNSERSSEAIVPLEINPQMQSLAFSCVGLWILVQALARAAPVTTLFALAVASKPHPLIEWLNLGLFEILALPVQIGLGLWLFLGARSFVGSLNYLRRVGRDVEPQNEDVDFEPNEN